MNCLLRVPVAAHATLIFQVEIAHDNGKLAARRGRKAVNLSERFGFRREFLTRARGTGEIVWLPKAIEESRDFEFLVNEIALAQFTHSAELPSSKAFPDKGSSSSSVECLRSRWNYSRAALVVV
jgi:hypothetical protein